jgi:2-polyprenyl-6-methoxyphenol hydroxylase-like FAD-dependent oxidoreductase
MHDVMIAGAGPVGLFLACELRLAGVSVLVLEAAADPAAPLKRLPFGLRGLSIPTVEALYRRGLLDAVAAVEPGKGRPGEVSAAPPAVAHWLQQPRRPAGHFAGIPFYEDDVDASAWPWRLPGPAQTPMAVEMQALETILAARAQALGAEVRRGLAVERLTQSDDAVSVRAGGQTFAGRWLVGCDGGRSVVRKAAGIGFAGTEPEFTGYSLEATLAEPDALVPGRHYTPTGMYTFARPGVIALVDFDGGAVHRTKPIGLEHAQAVVRRVSGVDVVLTALHTAATWTDRAFQAGAYRSGRVLLAGDAAHTHSPLGGQGLNLGLGDALNLGWKLAATARGEAPAGLLDSYEAERRPIGAQVLDWSRAQVALMRPTPATRALADIVRDLVATPDGATYFAGRVRGLGQRYDLGEIHPLAGRSAPDFGLAHATRLGDHLRPGGGLLLDFTADPALADVVARHGERLAYLVADTDDRLGLAALLIRPDGVVAWAADEGAADADAAAQAAALWFGSG